MTTVDASVQEHAGGAGGRARLLDDPPRPARAALVGLVVLPIVVAVVRALRHHWFPIGDDALLYIRVRDVLTSHHPFLGSWSSASLTLGTNINNPGPLYQDLATPFAHLFSPGPGAALGAASINVAAILGTSAASRHIGGWRMQRWFLLAAAALSWTMGSELLFDIWQAHALLLPFLCFLVLLVGVSTGRGRCVPWAVFVGSLLVQTHISYAYILGTLTPVAIALAWWTERAAGQRVDRARVLAGMRSRTALVSAVVLAAVWAQTLVEQIFGEGDGNLSRLVSNSGGGDVTLGFRNATKVVAAIVVLPPWWLRRGFSTTVPSTRLTETPDGPALLLAGLPHLAVAAFAVFALFTVLVLTARGCARRNRRLESNAAVLTAAGLVAAVVCLGLLTIGIVGFAAHHVRWLWTFAVAAQTIAGWTVSTLVLDMWRERRADPSSSRSAAGDRAVGAAVVALTVAFAALAVPFHAQQEGPVADTEAMPALRQVFRQLGGDAALDALRASEPIVYDISNLRVFEPYSAAVMMRLQELDVEFRVTDEGMVRQLGNGRRADGTETATIMQLEGSNALLHDGPECLLAAGNALDDAEQAAATTVADLLAGGLLDDTLFVDAAMLPDDERVRYEAARAGDDTEARRLVYEGLAARWLGDGVAGLDEAAVDALEAVLAEVPHRVVPPAEVDGSRRESITVSTFHLIDAWVVSTYALFGTGTLCPA